MKKSLFIYMLSAVLIVTGGCRKFVEVDQPGKRVLKYTADFDALLNHTFNMNTSYLLPWPYCDDMEVTDLVLEPRITNFVRQAYIWAESLYNDANDADWDRLYKQIHTCNQITDAVMGSEGGTQQEKQQILAAAKVLRAYIYLDLVNIYAKHYDASTAATDPGVPLLLNASLQQSMKRTPVKVVYEQIVKDLLEAAPSLPRLPYKQTQASQGSAYALLSRAHLYMGAYEDALKYADAALACKNTLLDLPTFANGGQFPDKLANPEVYLFRQMAPNSLTLYPLSPALQALFEPEDLRWTMYTRDGMNTGFTPAFQGRALWKHRLANDGLYVGPDVPEVMVTKAECLARLNKPAEAVEVLNTLRRHRFKPEDYTLLTAANATEALKLALNERRKEMMGKGTRLFDQKRLNREPAFAVTLTRTFLGETYTLAPNANRYVFPIASKYIAISPEMEQNPR